MNKIQKSTYIVIGVVFLFFVLFLMQIKGYFLTYFESKYVTSAISTNTFWDILKADINGINVFEGGPVYFLITKLFIIISGSSSEFIVRLPIVIISFLTSLFLYLYLLYFINRKYALISALTFCLNISFLTFSSVSIPQIMASNFSILAVLFGIFPLLSDNNKNKHLSFIGFWLFTFLVVYTDLFTAIVPVLVVFLSYFLFKKPKEMIKPINIILAVFSLFLIVYNWQILSYKVSENIPIFDYLNNAGNLHVLPYILIKYALGVLAGLMPWSILFIVLTGLFIFKGGYIKELLLKDFSNDKTLLTVSILGFLVSSLFFFLNHSFSNIILAVSFVSVSIAYFWHQYITDNQYKKVFKFSSSLFFSINLLFAVSVIFVYFFIDNSYKLYFEPILIPMIIITLLVSIPGLILVLIERRCLIFSAHLLFSVIFYFILTGNLFAYLNSFGESELITYAYGAKDNVSKLATYDLKNKYVLPYYFGNIVEFNDKLLPEEIFEKYGDSYDVRIITKIKNLEDFDKYFVYELLDSGKYYCVITNIKQLPADYLKNNETN